MMPSKKKLILLTGVLAVISYVFYSPFPDGYSFSTTVQLRLLLGVMNVVGVVGRTAEYLGFDFLNFSRSLVKSHGEGVIVDPSIQYRDMFFNGVRVRVYETTRQKDNKMRPGFVYFHGGGFTIGDIESSHALVLQMCNDTDVTFVSVGYRLAPEHPFPAAHDDCVTATKYFIEHSHQFNVDPNRIAVGGDSAGGNLAGSVSLRLRDEGFKPQPKMQVLLYPPLQMIDFQLPSFLANAQGPLLRLAQTAEFKAQYIEGHTKNSVAYQRNEHVSPEVKKKLAATFLNVQNLPSKYLVGYKRPNSIDSGDDRLWNTISEKLMNPYLAPLLAPDLSGQPITYILTCEYDVLRDEGFLYSHRLQQAGNVVMHHHLNNGFHGIISFATMFPELKSMLDDVDSYIRKPVISTDQLNMLH